MSIDTLVPVNIEVLLVAMACRANVEALYHNQVMPHPRCQALVDSLHPFVEDCPYRQDEEHLRQEEQDKIKTRKLLRNNAKVRIRKMLLRCECKASEEALVLVDKLDNPKAITRGEKRREKMVGPCEVCVGLRRNNYAIKRCERTCRRKLCGYHSVVHFCSVADCALIDNIVADCLAPQPAQQ